MGADGRRCEMKRTLLFGALGLGVAVGARRLARHFREFDFAEMVQRMPENAPPKWMFRNISAIRKNTERSRRNTERILELLENERLLSVAEPPQRAAEY
jgi:hypothetical protein